MLLHKIDYSFTHQKVSCYFDADFSVIETLVSKTNTIIITDSNVYTFHQAKLKGWEVIVIEPGEENKQQTTIDFIIAELIKKRANKKTYIIGIGGGVVTDIAAYVASIYMRGLPFGLVPTTILGMADAAIGGKNGIDVGIYKNIIGTIRQPFFLLYDFSFLETLPHEQWVNGFAEIIKHACINDEKLFAFLENNSIPAFKNDRNLLADLIEKNIQLKINIVIKDEFEKAERKLLNFGHTFGHAIENEYNLLHGHAISIGMVIAAKISEEINGFHSVQKDKLVQLLKKYELPVAIQYDPAKILSIMQLDKKAGNQEINYVLLNKIGEAVISSIPFKQLEYLINLCQ